MSASENKLGSFCTRCGNRLEASAAFCTSCGAKREVPTPVAVQATPQPVEQPVALASPTITPDTSTSAPMATSNVVTIATTAPPPSVVSMAPASKSSGSKTLIFVIAAVIVVGLAFGGWKYWQKSTRVEIEVSPDSATLMPDATTHVEAEVPNPLGVDVNWSVREGDKGGTVVGAGALSEQGAVKFVATYTAPDAPGTYHVVATLSNNSESTGETTITVNSIPK